MLVDGRTGRLDYVNVEATDGFVHFNIQLGVWASF